MDFSFQHGHSEEPPVPTKAIHIPQLSAEAQHLRPHFQPGAKFKGRPEWTAEGRQSPECGLAMVGSQQEAGTVTTEEVPWPPSVCAKMG